MRADYYDIKRDQRMEDARLAARVRRNKLRAQDEGIEDVVELKDLLPQATINLLRSRPKR